MSGQVVHFEIPAADLERAQEFYGEAFGWDLRPMPELDYTMVTTAPSDEQGMPTEPGAINGGMFVRDDARPAPIVTIGVDDVDAALATVEKLGGRTVIARTPVADMGFSAYFSDPEGNVVGLWENAG